MGKKRGVIMWMVFNRNDSWEYGFSVATKEETTRLCEEDKDLDYCYVGSETLAYAF